MGGSQSSPGAGPAPTQLEWATGVGVSPTGIAEFSGAVKAVNGSRVQEEAVQRSGRQIGSGQFGAVFHGTYMGSPVAIKSISLSGTAYATGQQSVDQLFRQIRLEIMTMSSMGTHPNCMHFFGSTGYFPHSGESRDALRIELILELNPNGTLFDNLHIKRLLELWPEKLRVLRGIAAGVEYLHSQSIVHRDLSSLNVLFSSEMQPKIADFGCARKCVGGYYDPEMVLGSPAYMSPEQLIGAKLSVKSDVWALGVLVWEVIAERGPWGDRDSNNRDALKHHIVDNNSKLPKIHSTRFEVMYAKHCEDQVADLLATCFRVTPGKRCSASDVVKALNAMDATQQRTHVKIDLSSSASSKRATGAHASVECAPPVPVPPVATATRKQIATIQQAEPAIGSQEYVVRLESKVRAFYTKYNPAKLDDVHLVTKFHVGKEDLLNERLRAQYNTDLVDFCRMHPELDSQDKPAGVRCSCALM